MSFATPMNDDFCYYTDTKWDHVEAYETVQSLYRRRNSALRILNRVEKYLCDYASQSGSTGITRETLIYWETEHKRSAANALDAYLAYFKRCAAENMWYSSVTRDVSGHIIKRETGTIW